ncbi:NAD(P)H-binding protein [Pendulispora albinea]|uniref:NAD(P)H-binding protein n=1 Tax=Pendulispora albinea TaxID=2741071 RepID=A0ABZ2LNT0_9BACT
MILVTGATGHVGGELAALLAAHGGARVRAMSRRPEAARFPAGIEPVRGDFEDDASLDRAMAGVERLFLVTTQATGTEGGPTHERLAVRAALRAGVEHIVKLSVLGGGRGPGVDSEDPIARWHSAAEAAVTDSGIAWTLLRPGRFMSNALQWGAMIQKGDKVHLSFATRPAASIDPADIAAVALRALTEPGHRNQAYELSGPEALTPEQELSILGAVLGRTLEPVPVPLEMARAGMQRSGFPSHVIDAIVARSVSTTHGTEVLSTVERITGRPPRTFEQWARAHAGAFR